MPESIPNFTAKIFGFYENDEKFMKSLISYDEPFDIRESWEKALKEGKIDESWFSVYFRINKIIEEMIFLTGQEPTKKQYAPKEVDEWKNKLDLSEAQIVHLREKVKEKEKSLKEIEKKLKERDQMIMDLLHTFKKDGSICSAPQTGITWMYEGPETYDYNSDNGCM